MLVVAGPGSGKTMTIPNYLHGMRFLVMQRLITADDNLINKFVNSHKLIEISCFGANKYN